MIRRVGRFAALLALCALALQLYFLARIALMIVVDPQSTTFQRSEIWRLAVEKRSVIWSQAWRPYGQLGDALKRAVIASEDARFADHTGVEWDAIEAAWERNQRAEARAERINSSTQAAAQRGRAGAAPARPAAQAKVVGGSTITQQLAYV